MPASLVPQCDHGRFERDGPAGPAARPIEDLVESGSLRFLSEQFEEVLLQRLTCCDRAPAQRGMDLRRDVLDLYARHSAILAHAQAKYNSQPGGGPVIGIGMAVGVLQSTCT